MAVMKLPAGPFFEDFEVGDRYVHSGGRTILEADNTWFSLLTNNTHPIHFDANYASRTEFGKPLVNSALSLAIIAGMSVPDTSQNAVANLGWEYIRIPAPVFAGDTLYSESVVLEKRESRTRPDVGIVHVETIGYNQDGTVVMEYKRAFMAFKEAFAPRSELNTFREELANQRAASPDTRPS